MESPSPSEQAPAHEPTVIKRPRSRQDNGLPGFTHCAPHGRSKDSLVGGRSGCCAESSGRDWKHSMLGRDKVCAVVAAPDAKSMRSQLARALRETRTVELRLDWLSSDLEIERFLKYLAGARPKATMIATCRRREAGGRYAGTIAKQLIHLAEAIRAGCEWYDLEIETLRKCPPELVDVALGEGRQLASAHFFRGMPKSLPRVAAELMPLPARRDQDRRALRLARRGALPVGFWNAASTRRRRSRWATSDCRRDFWRCGEGRVCLRSGRERHGARPDIARRNEARLSRGRS